MSAALCSLQEITARDPRPYKNVIPSFVSILKQVSTSSGICGSRKAIAMLFPTSPHKSTASLSHNTLCCCDARKENKVRKNNKNLCQSILARLAFCMAGKLNELLDSSFGLLCRSSEHRLPNPLITTGLLPRLSRYFLSEQSCRVLRSRPIRHMVKSIAQCRLPNVFKNSRQALSLSIKIADHCIAYLVFLITALPI